MATRSWGSTWGSTKSCCRVSGHCQLYCSPSEQNAATAAVGLCAGGIWDSVSLAALQLDDVSRAAAHMSGTVPCRSCIQFSLGRHLGSHASCCTIGVCLCFACLLHPRRRTLQHSLIAQDCAAAWIDSITALAGLHICLAVDGLISKSSQSSPSACMPVVHPTEPTELIAYGERGRHSSRMSCCCTCHPASQPSATVVPKRTKSILLRSHAKELAAFCSQQQLCKVVQQPSCIPRLCSHQL